MVWYWQLKKAIVNLGIAGLRLENFSWGQQFDVRIYGERGHHIEQWTPGAMEGSDKGGQMPPHPHK